MTAFLLLRRRPSAVLAALAAAPADAPVVDLSKSHPALYPGPASRAQAEAGNYKKRRVAFHGLTLRIENEAGTVREGAGWSTRMVYPYGEVEDSEGVDGDRVDCYLGPFLDEATHVFVVHQRKAGRWSEYDEDKCMLGFLSEEDAAIAYLQHYDDPRFLGPITALPVAEFVAKVRATRGAPAMVKGTWFGDADLLKATAKKMVTVPGYTKADGTYVPPHQKMVHYNPDHSFAAVAQGGVSHSQKQAHAKLAKEDWFHKLLVDEQAIHVMSLATDLQDAASASAAVSGWKAAAKSGKNPSAAQWAAFNALPKDKQAALYDEAKQAGSLAHLKPPVQAMEAGESVAAADPADKVGPGLQAAIAKKMAAEPDGGKYYLQGLIDSPATFEAVRAYAKKKLAELDASDKLPPAFGVPAYDYVAMNTGAKHSPKVLAQHWHDENPGNGAALSEALMSLGYAQLAADMDLPAPDSDEDGSAGQAAYDAAHGLDFSGQGAEPGPKEGDTKPGANGATLVFKDGRWHKQQDDNVAEFKKQADLAYSEGNHLGLQALADEGVHGYPEVAAHAQAHLNNLKAKDALEQIPKSGSFYQKEAFKELSAEPGWSDLGPAQKLDDVLALYKKKQGAASQSAAVSLWKKALLAGKVPSPAQQKAFIAMATAEPMKAGELLGKVSSEIGSDKLNELLKQANAAHLQSEPQAKGPMPTPAPTPAPSPAPAKASGGLPAGWSFEPVDHGFSGAPTLTFEDADGTFYVAKTDDGELQVGHLEAGAEPDWHENLSSAAAAATYLAKQAAGAGIAVPSKSVLQELLDKGAGAKFDEPKPAAPASDPLLELAKQHGLLGGSGVKSAINLFNAGNLDGLKTVKASLSPVKKHMHGFVQALIDKLTDRQAAAAEKELPAGWHEYPNGNAVALDGPGGSKIHIAIAPNGTNLSVTQKSADGKTIYHDGGHIPASAAKLAGSLANKTLSPAVVAKLQAIVDKNSPAATPAPTAAPAQPSMKTVTAPKYTYTNTTAGHNKQWAMYVVGSKLVTEYGPIGKTQQKTEKEFDSPDAANAAAMKLKKEKVSKGYKHAETSYNHKVEIPAEPAAAALPPVPKFVSGPSTFATAADKVAALAQAGDAGEIENDLQAAWGLTSKNAVQFQNYALAVMKHIGANKPEFVSAEQWEAGEVDAGPKDGDTKPGADGGTLVFKNGRWHKMGPKVSGKLTKTAADFAVNGSGVSLVGLANNSKSAINQAKEFAVAGNFDYVLALHSVISKAAKLPKAATAIGAIVQAMKAAGGKPSVPDPDLLTTLDAAVSKTVDKMVLGSYFVAQIELAKAAALAGDMATLDKVYQGVANTTSTSKAVLAIMAAVGAKKEGVSAFGSTATPPKPAPTTAPSDADPVVPKMAPAGAVKPGEPGSMAGWVQTGPQAGSNPGGKFKDKNGQEWYVKFPKSGDIAKNELLASKFYQMLGVEVPFLKLVEKDGKVGIASKWNPGVKKGSAATLAAAPGAHDGFVFDAWLANWDAVGPDFMNMQLAGGKAVRVDVGGSLLYRAQGGKKTDFGDTVLELDSLLDASKNAATAATFKGMSKKALDAGLQKLNMLKPSQIEELCEKIGPGSDAERKKLAATLIARRAFILNKYGVKDQWAAVKALDPTKLPVKAADLPKPLDFFTINGGKPKSSKAWKNEQNNKVSADLIAFAAKGNLVALKDYQYAEISDTAEGTPTGKMKSIVEHPSKDIQEQWVGLVELLQSIATPSIPTLEMPSMGAVGALDEISDFVGSFSPTERPETVAAEHRMGFFMALGQIEDIHGLLTGAKWSFIQKGGAWVQKMKAGFDSLSALTRKYISHVQASGSINHAWSQGKTEAASTPLQKLTAEIYKNAVDIPEGTVLRRGMSDTTAGKSMTKQLLAAKPGLVIQNTDSMCTSFNEQHSWGGDVQMTIRCAKGCKATPSFASGSYSSEYEITTLPGSRFVVLGVEKSGSSVKLDVLMLPPHEGFVAEVGKLAKLGKALQSVLLMIRRWF